MARQKKTNQAILVYVTCPNIGLARRISRALVEERLAACTNILPQMESHYRWEGRIHRDREVVLLIKSVKKNFKAIKGRVLALHSYKTPCVLQIAISAGSAEYLNWISSETAG